MKRFIQIAICLLSIVMITSSMSVFSYAENVYRDISEDDWFYDDVMYLYDYSEDSKMMYGDNLFAPNESFTRAMVVVMLHRFEETPSPDKMQNDPWAGKYAGAYFADACLWAKQSGVAKGYYDGDFHPDDKVTREEFTTFMLRYAEYKSYNTSSRKELSAFSDADTVGYWAKDAMEYSVATGLIRGRSDTELVPRGNITRAEAAAILHRFIENNK